MASEEAHLTSSVITPLTDELIRCIHACIPPGINFNEVLIEVGLLLGKKN